jgi:hypothetical protein
MLAEGVGHILLAITDSRLLNLSKARFGVMLPVRRARGVGQSFTAAEIGTLLFRPVRKSFPVGDTVPGAKVLPPVPIDASGVGHNPDSVSSVRGVDGASWKYNRLDFVAFTFQVR